MVPSPPSNILKHIESDLLAQELEDQEEDEHFILAPLEGEDGEEESENEQ